MSLAIERRLRVLEQQHRPRRRGLSSERRKYLTDSAVRGDQDALQELERHRPQVIQASPEQRSAALAAGLRADL